MALNIKNEDVEKVLEDVIAVTGESKTEAVRIALEERRQRLALRNLTAGNKDRLTAFLQDEIWSQVPPELLGTKLTKAEEEEILGYGKDGV